MGWSLFRRKTLVLALLAVWGIGNQAFAEAPVQVQAPVSSSVQPLPPAASVLPPEVHALTWEDHPKVRQALAYYLGPGRAWVERCLERAEPYRDFIHMRLEQAGMPDDLFWLVAVESGFNAAATSRAGAAGLWQFMKNSVDGYGMEIGTFVDQRRDWWKATDGAIQKLKDNYRVLGDWDLALAAYNAGLGRMQYILRKAHGERNYWRLLDRGLLPRETAGYVPQLVALARISSHWASWGFPVSWNPSPVWSRIHLERMIDLRLLADAASVPVEDLRAANPELRSYLTPALRHGYDLKVLAQWVDPLEKALSDPHLKLIRYYLYPIHSGDTLSEIALWYGVSMPMIEHNNPGLDRSRLKIGKVLVIPAMRDVGPYRNGESRG